MMASPAGLAVFFPSKVFSFQGLLPVSILSPTSLQARVACTIFVGVFHNILSGEVENTLSRALFH